MEKYKSSFIKEEDIRVKTDRRWIGDTRIEIVEIQHIPSRFIASSKNKSQLKAYEEALKLIERRINDLINSNA